MRSSLRIAASALTLALAAPSLASQVVISEVGFDSGKQWIEIQNLGNSAEDVSTWSIYQATQTPNKPQNYWWAFPRGTSIGGGKFLRVHWLQFVANCPANNLCTGTTIFHFMFGLFAEPLDQSRGALALFSTQLSNQMNNPTKIQSWVSWGTSGFKREDVAIQANRWTKNSAAPAPSGLPLPSLAFAYTNPSGPNSATDWFLDSTPTPGKENLGGAFATSYGVACQGTLTQIARQFVNSVPAHGNKNYLLGIDRPLLANELALLLLSIRGDGKILVRNCPYWLNPLVVPFVLFVPKVGNIAQFSFNAISPDALGGMQFSTQWGVFDVVNDKLGLTNGVQMRFGMK
jgi:hypothetical protein